MFTKAGLVKRLLFYWNFEQSTPKDRAPIAFILQSCRAVSSLRQKNKLSISLEQGSPSSFFKDTYVNIE